MGYVGKRKDVAKKNLVRGEESRAAKGATKRRAAAIAEAEQRAKTKIEHGVNAALSTEAVEARANELLVKHNIDPTPGKLAFAGDAVKAGEAADMLYRMLSGSRGEVAARLASGMATLLKQRRVCLKDIGIPGDPDDELVPKKKVGRPRKERERTAADIAGAGPTPPVRAPSPAPPASPIAPVKRNLDFYLED